MTAYSDRTPYKLSSRVVKGTKCSKSNCNRAYTGADPEIFQRGGGVEEETFERKMFVDRKLDKHATLSLSSSFSGGINPSTPPPLDPPMLKDKIKMGFDCICRFYQLPRAKIIIKNAYFVYKWWCRETLCRGRVGG